MAKAPAKKTARKKTAKKSTASGAASTRISRVKLTAKQTAAAKQCLERSGTIKLGFKDITVTKLPKSIAPVLVFVD